MPEAWQRKEAEREGRRQELKLGSVAVIVLAAIAALVYAVVAWSKGRSDRRAFWAAAALTLVMMYSGSANNWPEVAMQLKTAEPVRNQLTLVVLGMLAGGVVMASLLGLLAGVGAHYARAQPAVPLAGRGPAWLQGAAAALVTAGIAAALTALVPATMPVWPDVRTAAAAWPWARTVTAGLSFVPAVTITLFLLAIVARATAGWTRRIPLAALVLVLFGVAVAILAGRDVGHALLEGVVEGLATLAMAWLVLRHDLSTVPAFVATGLALEGVKGAAQAGTFATWALFAGALVVMVALAVAAARYLALRTSARA